AANVQHSVVVEDALGWTLFRAGHPHAALRAADRALRLGTLDASFLFHRGAIEASLGMSGGARRDLAEALRVNPHFSVLYAPLARHLLAEVSRGGGAGPWSLSRSAPCWPPPPRARRRRSRTMRLP